MKELKDFKSRYDFSLDNRQAILIISGLILVLMLSFLMGTLFGRNLARMAGEGEVTVAALETVDVEADDALEASGEAPAPAISADLDDEENTKKPEADSSSREDFIRQLESMKIPARVKSSDEKLAAVLPPVLGNLEKAVTAKPAGPSKDTAKAPAAEKKKDKAPASSRPVIHAGAYTIQLSSLPDKDDAEAKIEELRGKKYDAYMLQVTLPGKGTFYRVRMGHYKNLEQARKALTILQSREGKYFDAWITQ